MNYSDQAMGILPESTTYSITTEPEIYVDELDDEDPLNIDRFSY